MHYQLSGLIDYYRVRPCHRHVVPEVFRNAV